jgi:hypothetical protein
MELESRDYLFLMQHRIAWPKLVILEGKDRDKNNALSMAANFTSIWW